MDFKCPALGGAEHTQSQISALRTSEAVNTKLSVSQLKCQLSLFLFSDVSSVRHWADGCDREKDSV